MAFFAKSNADFIKRTFATAGDSCHSALSDEFDVFCFVCHDDVFLKFLLFFCFDDANIEIYFFAPKYESIFFKKKCEKPHF